MKQERLHRHIFTLPSDWLLKNLTPERAVYEEHLCSVCNL